MREKGLEYKLNWGASLIMLRQEAERIGQDYHLAIELWKEDIRECKILATMLMPPEEMLPEVAELWMEQTHNVEIAEQAAFNLYQHMPSAASLAYKWIASPRELDQLCGFHILSRLFRKGQSPNERGINEYIDQTLASLQGPYVSVRKAAMLSLQHFAELGLVYERMARSATKSIHLDIF
jgi:3-methyladenine DNA glycosylase AlkD